MIAPFADKCILIVDDEEDLRELVAFEFQRTGCAILEAGSGHEAWAVLEREKVDLVISDIRMPNGNGIELLERIRDRRPSVSVILITGFADILKSEALKKGAIAVFDKPLDRKGLVKTAEAALSKKAA